jgi:hypothetical protein
VKLQRHFFRQPFRDSVDQNGKTPVSPFRIVFSYKLHQKVSALAWDHYLAGDVSVNVQPGKGWFVQCGRIIEQSFARESLRMWPADV